jgi:hypothetical protein
MNPRVDRLNRALAKQTKKIGVTVILATAAVFLAMTTRGHMI